MPSSAKRKISESRIGKRWFTNGEVDVPSFECPEGFRLGRKIKGAKYKTKRNDPNIV